MDVRTEQPLVSIICFCKDRAATIRRSIDSVLGQSYRHIEFVVQDGASTDGTLEILRSDDDPRIKLVSEKDSGPAEAFWKVMNRCEGAIIGTCLSDEELLPGIVEQAVGWFREEPRIGAITCDGYFTDAEGTITGEFNAGDFNLVDYFFGRYCPFWPGSFFRRQALLDVGLGDHDWTIECLEFETWCRLGTRHEVKYVPVRASKYAIHPSQLSNTTQAFHEHFDHRAIVIRAMFSESGFFGRDDAILRGCLYNQQHQLYNHVKWNKLAAQEALLAQRLQEMKAGIPPQDLSRCREYFTFVDTPLNSPTGFSPKLYHDVAAIYLGRGQVDQALALWRKAEVLRDAEIDRLACEAMLRSPHATFEQLATSRTQWAHRHIGDIPGLGPCPVVPYAGDRKVRVAYLCAGPDDERLPALREVLRHADRERFTIVGYVPGAAHPLTPIFDEYTNTASLSDADFVRLARRDLVDICVDTAGLTPHHRLAALANRCAPIQVSYPGRTGTTGVSNIDYVLADEVAAPRAHDAYFTETVWRIPGCFLPAASDEQDNALVSNPPLLRAGHVTFGCREIGGHINLPTIEMWAALLRQVPGSRLVLWNRELSPPDNRDFMESRFQRFRITPDRLTMLAATDRGTAGAYYEGIDLTLDTCPYGGGATVAESLRQGVPVITLMTDRFGGRDGASILLAAGCGELVASTPARYVYIAKELADAPDRLWRYRTGLPALMRQHGLADVTAFARKLESAYLTMMDRLLDRYAETR